MYNQLKRSLRRIRRTANELLGRSPRIRVELGRTIRMFGREPYAWAVCPDHLGPDSIVYSAGVGQDASFDLALISEFNCTVHAFDPTPASISWFRQQLWPSTMVLHEYGIAGSDGTLAFYPPRHPGHVSHSVIRLSSTDHSETAYLPVSRLRSIMHNLGHCRIDLLKLDIEGAEFDVIDDITATQVPVTQLAVEFHDRLIPGGSTKTKDALIKLSRAGYQIVHVSDTGEEVTFVFTGLDPDGTWLPQ